MFHLLMCIWCLLIATISGVAMHPEIKDTQKRHLIKMKLRAITTRSYPSPSVTDQTAGNRLHTPESLWRYYIAFIYIFYRVWSESCVRERKRGPLALTSSSTFSNGVSHMNPLRGAITFPLKWEGIRDPCSFLIQFAHGPQTKEEPSIGSELLMSWLVKSRVLGPAVIH